MGVTSISSAYLVLYNAVLAAGWAYILVLLVGSIGSCSQGSKDGHEKDLFPSWVSPARGIFCVVSDNKETFELLKIFQTAAVLEIVHAWLKIVKSSVGTTFQQVFSRVMLVWGVVFVMPSLTFSAAFVTMGLAWSVTEVVRYSWYALKIVNGEAPYALTWCRYTFFIALYPIGVWSELRCNFAVTNYFTEMEAEGQVNDTEDDDVLLRKLFGAYAYFIYFFIFLYLPIFPGLYLHMFAQRKKTLGKPRLKRSMGTEGIQFPTNSKGVKSTSAVGQAVFTASMFEADNELAMQCAKEKNWRFGYVKHVINNTALCCRDTDTCLKVAEDGLNFIYDTFEFVRDGKVMSVKDAMNNITASFPGTMTVTGTGSKQTEGYVVPYRSAPYPAVTDPVDLKGDDLIAQLNKWADAGTIEPSCRDAIADVVKNKKWQDLSDRYFVLLGAGSAMGPLQVLLSLGANVIALDLDREPIWDRLIKMAQDSCGTMTFPLSKKESEINPAEAAKYAGCNLFTQTPEICNWLKSIYKGKPLVIGGYAYLDGEAHVRVSLAMDAISAGVSAARPKGSVSLAYLCSPTDVFVVDKESYDAAQANRKAGGAVNVFAKVMNAFSKNICVPNKVPVAKGKDGTEYYINNGIVVEQGPNYALAKRLQHWRAMLARSTGTPVSTNIAPSTATISVVHNRSFAIAYSGFGFFKPMEVSFQETSNAVMGALLLHDVCSPKSEALPKTNIGNPINLFKGGSFHGGIWRCAYTIGSIGKAAGGLYFLKLAVPYIAFTLVASGIAVTVAFNSN